MLRIKLNPGLVCLKNRSPVAGDLLQNFIPSVNAEAYPQYYLVRSGFVLYVCSGNPIWQRQNQATYTDYGREAHKGGSLK
jgi:hypothetical protein